MPDDPFPPDLNDVEFGSTMRGHQKGDRAFGRFLLGRQIGRGGMGVVWLAFDERLGREVALKFAPDEIRFDTAAIEELKEETRRGLELAHPNIVKIYDFLIDENHAAISMEFIDGEHLGALRSQQAGKVFEPDQIAPWVAQLLDALHYAHNQAKLIHCDLKPANLMIGRDNVLRVTDFGIARSISEAVNRVTLGKTCAGTLAYMSPQQAGGRPPGVSDDIYAVGSTLYELLTGKPPFYSGDIAHQLQSDKPAPITVRRQELGLTTTRELPRAWEEVVMTCLEKDPSRRPPDARTIAERLGLQTEERGTFAASPLRGGTRRRAVLISATAALAAAGYGGWKMWTRPRHEPLPETPRAPETKPALPGTGSIQTLINQATEGQVVTIPAGEYEEQVQFRNGITLAAAASGKVIVRTGGRTGSALRVDHCASGTIRGIIFEHSGKDTVEEDAFPVGQVKSSSVTIEECTFRRGIGDGLLITGIGTPTVLRCTFNNNADSRSGLVIEGGSTAVARQCSAFKNGGSGIEVRFSGTAATLIGNTCSDNQDSGIVVKDMASAEIKEHNVCHKNLEAGIAAAGSAGSSATSVVITDAECVENRLGITIQEGARARMSACTVLRSTEMGVHLGVPASLTEVTGCTIEDSISNGILIVGAADTRLIITGNKIRKSGGEGILVTGSEGVVFQAQIENNECEMNAEFGIAVINGASGVVRGNICRGNNLGSIEQQKAGPGLIVENNTTEEAPVK